MGYQSPERLPLINLLLLMVTVELPLHESSDSSFTDSH